MNTKVAILGCGWLGLPLAEHLIEKGYKTNGSTTATNKLKTLQQKGIEAFYIYLTEEKIEGKITDFLHQIETLIISIPPKAKTSYFPNKLKKLVPFIEKSSVKKVIFISSTSVFQDTFPFLEVTAKTQPNAKTENGKQLIEAENILLSNSNFQTAILRFGGLIGKNRHPVNHLAGKTNIPNPNAPINVIEQKSCIFHIEKILHNFENTSKNSITNAVDNLNLSRKEFYTTQAKLRGLAQPLFNETETSKGKKIITSTEIMA